MRPNGLLRYASLLVLTSSVGLGACNALTGVEDLVLDEENAAGPGGGEGGSAGNTGTTIGAGGNTTTTTTTPTPIQLPPGDAPGVTITQIALYQGVKATLMENGAAVNNTVPIVAGRDALMRVFLAVDGNYNNKQVTARLTINGVAGSIEYLSDVNGAPKDNALSSTLNFKIPGNSIGPGFAFRVELLQAAEDTKGSNPGAHYPAEGFASTSAQSNGASLKVVLVPIKYGADGSNRLPDTSPAHIQGYKDLFYSMYPTPAVDLTVREPVQYNNTVSNNGNGWENLLAYIGQVRANDNAPFEAYYYGIFSPAAGVGQYCGGGCVAGLGNIGGPSEEYTRAAIGLGFSDDGGAIAWETAVHEIGHTHGRYHSPCGGAAGADPQYPHQNAIIGVWGYNLLTEKLYSPTGYTDVMGYCQPIWVSDFTYKAFFNRIKAVNNANFVAPPELMNRTYDRAMIDADGNMQWLPAIPLQRPPQDSPVDLTVENDDGAYAVTGHFYPYDHLPGGVMLWPQQAGLPSASVSFEWEGSLKSLWK